MQPRRWIAVWLGVGAIAACAVPDDGLAPTTADVAAINAAAAGEPVALLKAPLDELAQRAYIKASNTGREDEFGYSVALSADGSTLAVGARGEDSAATSVDGDQADNSAPDAGAVYVFRRRGKTWIQQAYLKASPPRPYGYFGVSVALSADGATLAVGEADNSTQYAGAVHVFTRRGTKWSQEAYLKASPPGANDYFGESIALSADGSTLAVGAYGEDSAATGVGGSQVDDSAEYAGAVYVFTRSGTTWSQEAYVKASNTEAYDTFGWSVALSADGSTLAVSAIHEYSAATGVGGDQADNSAQFAGAVYVFARGGAAWSQEAYVKASNTDALDFFGRSVALSADGSTLAVSASGEASAATGVGGSQVDNSVNAAGAVYVFTRSGTAWSQEAYVKASNPDAYDFFGSSVALSADGSTLAVGAVSEDSAATGVGGSQVDNSAIDAGAVYVFTRSGTAWSQEAYVKASNTNPADSFSRVALSGDASTLAVGAPYEDSAATGIGGDQADHSADWAGAVYVFDRRR